MYHNNGYSDYCSEPANAVRVYSSRTTHYQLEGRIAKGTREGYILLKVVQQYTIPLRGVSRSIRPKLKVILRPNSVYHTRDSDELTREYCSGVAKHYNTAYEYLLAGRIAK